MTTETKSDPWTQKYRPKTLQQVVGNEKAVKKILDWLRKWNSSASEKGTTQKKAVLLFGPPGVGKTVVVEAIANGFDYILVEMNASDFRTSEQIEKLVTRSIGYQTLDNAIFGGGGRIILFDEMDGISGKGDQGGVGAIIDVIKKTRCPVFLTANDIYHPRLRDLRSYCFEVEFDRLGEDAVASYLDRICKSEGIEADRDALLLIARNADGDMRVAVNDLQALGEGRNKLIVGDVTVYSRDVQEQTFDALRSFFAAKTWGEARKSIEEATIDQETMMLCIHESLPYQFKDPRDLATAYDLLSRADMFLGKSQRERAWQLMKYFYDFMTSIPLFRTRGWPSSYVRFSQKLVEMSRSRTQRSLRREVGRLIGGKLHVSSDTAVKEVVPHLKVIFSANPKAAAEISSWLELSEDMIKYISGENADQILRLMK